MESTEEKLVLDDGKPETVAFLDRYTKWCDKFTDAPLQYHQSVAYWMIGSVIGRNCFMTVGDQQIFPNIWLLVLGPSSFYRKTTSIFIARKMLKAICPESLISDQWTMESLIAIMQTEPKGIMIHSEFKSFLSVLQKDYNHGAQSFLTELYDCNSFSRVRGTSDIKRYSIESPFLSLAAASTMEWLQNSIKHEDISGGFLARFLVVSADKKEKDLPFPPKADEVIRQQLIGLLKLTAGRSREIIYSQAAKEEYADWYGSLRRTTDKMPEMLRGFLTRLQVYCHKIAIIEATLNDTGTVTPDIVAKAIAYCSERVNEIVSLGDTSLGRSKFDAMGMRVQGIVDRNPGIDYSRLLKNSNISAKYLHDVLDTLVKRGDVLILEKRYFPNEHRAAAGDS